MGAGQVALTAQSREIVEFLVLPVAADQTHPGATATVHGAGPSRNKGMGSLQSLLLPTTRTGMDHNLPDHLGEMISDGIDTARVVPAVDFLEIWTLMYRATVALTTAHAIPAVTIRTRIQTGGRQIDMIFAGTIRLGDEVVAPTTEKGEGDKT